MFDYFYGQQAELFSFYRIPKVLFTRESFWNISTDAKLLYGILLDRMELSARNGWMDKEGRVYIIFTIDEIKSALGCAEKKAVKLLDELEKKCGLIERKRQGLGNVVSPEEKLSDNVYHYDGKERLFELADKYENRMNQRAAEKETARTSVLDTLHNSQKELADQPRKTSSPIKKEEAVL